MHQRPYKASLAATALLATLAYAVAAAAEQPALSPLELVRRAVHNELQANRDGPKHMFLDRKETPRGSQTKLIVETRDAMAGLVIANDGKPLTAEQEHAETARVERFLNDPEELRKRQRQEKEEADRVNRIMKALPDAFLYEYQGAETGAQGLGKPGDPMVRLKFRPNPNYDPPSRVEQVLTGMGGYLVGGRSEISDCQDRRHSDRRRRLRMGHPWPLWIEAGTFWSNRDK